MGLPVEVNNLMLGSLGGYTVGRSLRFRSSASAYLNRTNVASPTNANKWTMSWWMKRGNSGSSYVFSATNSGNDDAYMQFNSDKFTLGSYQGAGTDYGITTSAVFRDYSAWYHIVCVYDSSNATSADRAIIYINGVRQTVTNQSNGMFPLNYTGNKFNLGSQGVRCALRGVFNDNQFDGYLAEVNFIDGQALTPSSFGAYDTNGVWQPKKYSGTYGTNGFYLPFSNTASTTTLVQDSSGNGNNWTPNNISLTAGTTYDSMIDSPTNSASSSNYATWNPLWTNVPGISSGNLNVTGPDNTAMATIGMPSGKWYFETTVTSVGAITAIGMCATQPGATNYPGYLSDGYCYVSSGNKQNNNSAVSYGASYTSGDVIGCAFDADAGTLTFYKNNVSQGTAYSSIPSKTYYFAVYGRSSGGSNDLKANFGQQPFTYTPPSGYKALNTYNLPDSTIKKGNKFFDTSLFTGTSGNVTISGLDFQPDFVWLKARSNAQGHTLFDSVRGVSKYLQSNLTNAEATMTNPPSFTSDGWVSTTDTHTNGYTYVGWQWKGGGTGVSNTSGSITSTVSANTTAGFSVVTYTGTGANATVGHGLGVAPSMIIIKNRQAANSWVVYHVSTGNGNVLLLNSTNASTADSTAWNTTTPTSSVFSLGSGAAADTNQTTGGGQHVAYCFAAVRGYSAFGSYTGNGSTDGPFCYTGFRPRWVMIKNSSVVSNWFIFDTSRDTYNIVSAQLQPNTSAAEQSGGVLDILSNGFKLRDTTASVNGNGNTIIYAAFSESPFNISRGR